MSTSKSQGDDARVNSVRENSTLYMCNIGESGGRKITRGRLKLGGRKMKKGKKGANVVAGLQTQRLEESSGRVIKLVIQADVVTVISGLTFP